MAKRVKHVFDTSEVPHLWAHRTQESARNKQGNLYFDGDTIYSYGGHFPIARHVVNGKGKRAIVFTTRGYSSTTAGHIAAVRQAIPVGTLVFHLQRPDSRPDAKVAFEDYESRIQLALEDAAKRKAEYRRKGDINTVISTIAECKAFAKFYGVKVPKFPKVPKIDERKCVRQLAERQRRETIRSETRRAEWEEQDRLRAEEHAATLEDRITRWRAGEHIWNKAGFPETAMLRRQGEDVQTSQGAVVSVKDAMRCLTLVKAVRADGREWVKNGHTFHIGHYEVNRITPEGTLYAGCHVIEWPEIERIAPELEATTATPATQ